MKVKTWDGNNINDGSTYVSFLNEPAYGLPRVQAAMGMRHGRWPLVGAVERPGRFLFLDIEIRNFTATNEKNLLSYFDPEDEDPKQLVVEDDAGGNDRYWECICESLQAENRFHYIATLRVHGDVRLRETSATAASAWNITASGQTKALTNNGADDAYPVIKIKPTSTKTGNYAYKVWIPVRWRVSAAYNKYPIDITNDSWNTATLVSGAKMQSDGDDLRVWVDGVEVNRWLDGINTTTTKVWVNLDFQAKQEFTLNGGLGTGDATINVNESIDAMPSAGILYVDSEAIVYTGKSNSLKRFTGCSRGQKGTTAATHTTGTTIWWVQHDVWILYGNSSASAPTVDDNYKPMFSLSTSTNTSWDYDDFYEDDGLRTGAWYQHTGTGSPGFYGGNHATLTDPYNELGLDVRASDESGSWRIYNPCGITAANFQNGEKYKASSTYWYASIESSVSGSGSWPNEYSITEPSSAVTWESWSQNETLNSGSKYVGLFLWEPIGSVQLYLEAADVTLTLDSTYTPTISIGSEQGNYSLAATLTNNTTGDAIQVTFTMELNQEIEIDTYDKTVVYLKDNSSQMQALELVSTPRRDWLKLQPGSNTWQYDETGAAAVTVTITYVERHYT